MCKKATKKTINVRHLELELEKRNKICDGTAATVKANKHTHTPIQIKPNVFQNKNVQRLTSGGNKVKREKLQI